MCECVGADGLKWIPKEYNQCRGSDSLSPITEEDRVRRGICGG